MLYLACLDSHLLYFPPPLLVLGGDEAVLAFTAAEDQGRLKIPSGVAQADARLADYPPIPELPVTYQGLVEGRRGQKEIQENCVMIDVVDLEIALDTQGT